MTIFLFDIKPIKDDFAKSLSQMIELGDLQLDEELIIAAKTALLPIQEVLIDAWVREHVHSQRFIYSLDAQTYQRGLHRSVFAFSALFKRTNNAIVISEDADVDIDRDCLIVSTTKPNSLRVNQSIA